MKRSIPKPAFFKAIFLRLWLLGLFAWMAASCRPVDDQRYVAPSLSFAAAEYVVDATTGGMDVLLLLDRPAQKEISVRVDVSSSLTPGTQYSLPDFPLTVAAGTERIPIHLKLVDEAILVEQAYVDLILLPAVDYGVNLQGAGQTHIRITKELPFPTLKFLLPEGSPIGANTFLAETVPCIVSSNIPVDADLPFTLNVSTLTAGEDYTLDGACVLPAGTSQTTFNLKVSRREQLGFDKEGTVSLVAQEGVYLVDPTASSFTLHIGDPVPDFFKLLHTAAAQGGLGYQVRQALKTPATAEAPEGSWEGNGIVDLGQTVAGSPYLRNYRNMWRHSTYNCPCNASPSQWLRMSDLFPNRVYPSPTAILDYGVTQVQRQFSPADSVMRFCPNPAAPLTGKVVLTKPRTFTAFIGDYAAWQADVTGGKTWMVDARATGGDIFASTNPAITGTINVTVERIEGTFDFNKVDEMVLLSVWMRSDSDQFLMDGDARMTKYAIEQVEPGLWKLQYKLWPR
ncbi:MAG: hypothetical protein J6Y32_01780 [Bacteroidales bacterium]|nr:hypothetical protein [Bacteroidales bacterium]